MTHPFAKHGIEHLSPSSLNLYGANPALWCGRYLLGWKDDFGPAASRGTAVEAGLDSWLYKRDTKEAIAEAITNFALNTNGLADEEHETERANVEPMLLQAIAGLGAFPTPLGRQVRVEHYIDGVEVPVIGYIDYLFEGFGLDLKTTKACPSSIKADHGRQMALYSAAKKRPWKVLYCTSKKSALIDLTDNESATHLRDLERQARAVRHMLSKADNARDAARLFAPDPSDFRWSEKTIELAHQVYAAA